jgi:hypothetical protein
VHRERLVENGFLQEVMKGWLISASPTARAGNSTPWYASFWEFCARYCRERFGDDWHLSAEQSLWLHGGRTVIPDRVVVCSPGRYDSSWDAVEFWGKDGATRVRSAISRESMDDHFHGDNKNKLEMFRAHRRAIEQITRRKYLSGRLEADNSVLVRTRDIESEEIIVQKILPTLSSFFQALPKVARAGI